MTTMIAATMFFLHVVAAVLATWRTTDLMTQDRITQRIRMRLNTYLWSCPRCMSVWCGGLCALLFALGPVTHDATRWALWPFALGWLYMWHVESVIAKRLHDEGRRLVIEARGPTANVIRNDFPIQETQQILSQMLTQMIQPKPSMPPAPEATSPAPAHVNGGVK